VSRERSEVRGQQEVVKLRKWEDGKVGSRGHGAKYIATPNSERGL